MTPQRDQVTPNGNLSSDELNNVGHAKGSSTASSKRSSDGEDRSPVKKRKIISRDAASNELDHQNDSESERSSQATRVSGEMSKSIDSSIVDQDDNACKHDRFEKHDGVSSLGLWPYCALICKCGQKIIQARGTDMPAIGHGPPRRLWEAMQE